MLVDAGPEELKAHVDSLGVPVFVVDVDADGTLRYAALNAVVEAATGLHSAEVAGRCPSDVLPPRTAAHVTACYRECAAAARPVQYEEELDLPSGTIHCRTTLSPLMRDGRVVRLVGTVADISDLRRSERAREATEERLRDFLRAASDWLWEMDADLRFSWVSGCTEAERPFVEGMPGRTRWEVAGGDPERDAKWRRHRADLLARRPFRDLHLSFTDAAGRLRHRSVSGTPVFGSDGAFLGYRGTSRDVTEEIEAAQRLRDSEARLAMALDAAQAGWFELDLDTQQGRYSAQAEAMLGYMPGELSSSQETWQARVHPDDLPAMERALRKHCRGETPIYRAEYRQRTKLGGWRWMAAAGKVIAWNADGSPRRMLGIRVDAHERKAAQLEIEQLALTDSLTGLPNRAYFLAELGRAVARQRRTGQPFVVAVLDLDHFKDVNDTLGHSTGDDLLVEAGRRLREAVRASDLLARLGGDEFAIIAQDIEVPCDVDRLTQRLIGALDEPVRVSGTHVRTSTSIGVTVCTRPPATIEQLLADADVALYAAKSDGRSTWRLYDAQMEAEVRARRALERDLRRGLDEEQFELWYQPVIDLATWQAVGVEALIRWNHPERGWVTPDHFIPAAERNRLILPLTEWVVRTAFAQSRAWQEAGLADLSVAVNISTRCLRTEGLVEFVARALADTGADPRRIVVEITESSLADEKRAVPVINALKALGVRVAVDDFGTGYSSMARLKVLPVDQLKIDRSFITDVTNDEKNRAITEAMVTLAASLRMRVVAEGVETPAEVQRLVELGCDEAQGFLFARPMPAIDIPAWAAAWPDRDADHVHDLLRHRRERARAPARRVGFPA